MSSKLDLLRQENAKLMGENASLLAKEAGLMARIVGDMESRPQVNHNTKTVPSGNDQSHVILTESPSLQTEVSELEQDDEIDKTQIVEQGNDQINAEVSASSNAQSALSLKDNILPENKIPSIDHASVSAHDRNYFRNKILGRYPDIYREFSSKKFDYYEIIDKSLCPACKSSHKDEKSIRGRCEAGSYFIKCGEYEIEITT
ncbi:7484_t:CDS:2 [Ambispora gerdemannii]|uniref:7484_t:CDS:1 n=1 Tax=Ambispora gerdemannii TaxID=144530 RepID=A0A9N9CPF6_9GLOM|nr:7484_t:CDS:2 [Ambispora gerdemannii]